MLKPINIAKLAAKKAENKKAENLLILEMTRLTYFTDYFVIVSGNSNVHVQSIADFIIKELKKKKIVLNHIEGYREANWILLDYNEIIIHVFHRDTREYYQIEELWGDAKKIKV
ncbi:MAG: ribosome silencing factor [bacterium]|nr:ribosome silencing factor [bacterium]